MVSNTKTSGTNNTNYRFNGHQHGLFIRQVGPSTANTNTTTLPLLNLLLLTLALPTTQLIKSISVGLTRTLLHGRIARTVRLPIRHFTGTQIHTRRDSLNLLIQSRIRTGVRTPRLDQLRLGIDDLRISTKRMRSTVSRFFDPTTLVRNSQLVSQRNSIHNLQHDNLNRHHRAANRVVSTNITTTQQRIFRTFVRRTTRHLITTLANTNLITLRIRRIHRTNDRILHNYQLTVNKRLHNNNFQLVLTKNQGIATLLRNRTRNQRNVRQVNFQVRVDITDDDSYGQRYDNHDDDDDDSNNHLQLLNNSYQQHFQHEYKHRNLDNLHRHQIRHQVGQQHVRDCQHLNIYILLTNALIVNYHQFVNKRKFTTVNGLLIHDNEFIATRIFLNEHIHSLIARQFSQHFNRRNELFLHLFNRSVNRTNYLVPELDNHCQIVNNNDLEFNLNDNLGGRVKNGKRSTISTTLKS